MSLTHLAKAAFETVRISVPTVLQGAFGTLTPQTCDVRLDSWSKRILAQADIRLDVDGHAYAATTETFVVMSNHQSLYDIPVIFQALKRRVRMVAKAELFRVPLWSQAMRQAGFVSVDRKNRTRAIGELLSARTALDQGVNIWIAPEGTRSESGRLGQFKHGGFHLALATGARILPVTISGTRDALVARGWRVRNGAHVRVTISPPIDPKEYGSSRRRELVELVKHAIALHLPEEREVQRINEQNSQRAEVSNPTNASINL